MAEFETTIENQASKDARKRAKERIKARRVLKQQAKDEEDFQFLREVLGL